MSDEQESSDLKFHCFFGPLALALLAALFAYAVKVLWPAGYVLGLFVGFFGMIVVPVSYASLCLLTIFGGGTEPQDQTLAKYGLAGSVTTLLWVTALLSILSSRAMF